MKQIMKIAEFAREQFYNERPLSVHSIGAISVEEDGKHVFPVSDGENIYKITVEAI